MEFLVRIWMWKVFGHLRQSLWWHPQSLTIAGLHRRIISTIICQILTHKKLSCGTLDPALNKALQVGQWHPKDLFSPIKFVSGNVLVSVLSQITRSYYRNIFARCETTWSRKRANAPYNSKKNAKFSQVSPKKSFNRKKYECEVVNISKMSSFSLMTKKDFKMRWRRLMNWKKRKILKMLKMLSFHSYLVKHSSSTKEGFQTNEKVTWNIIYLPRVRVW